MLAFASGTPVAAAQSEADAELLALATEIAEADQSFVAAIDRTGAAESAFHRAKPPRPVAHTVPDVSDKEWFKLLRQKTASEREAGPSVEALAHDAAVAS